MNAKQKRKNMPLPQTFWQKYGMLLAFSLYSLVLTLAGITYSIIMTQSWDVYYPPLDPLLMLSKAGVYALVFLIPIMLRWGWWRLRQRYRFIFVLTLIISFVCSAIIVLMYSTVADNHIDIRYHTSLGEVDYYVAKGLFRNPNNGNFLMLTNIYDLEPPFNKSTTGHISIYACDKGMGQCPIVEQSDIQITWLDDWYDISDDGTQIIVTFKVRDSDEIYTYTYRPEQ